jgi:hypothetical protein
MSCIKGYLQAWKNIALALSPVWIVISLFYGLLSVPNLYLFYLITTSSLGGVLKVVIDRR